MRSDTAYMPFSAIVGHEMLKTVYLANLVDPAIGGLLITGAKGTGKSTLVYSVAGLLPDYAAVDGCPFRCDPDHPERFCSFCLERPDSGEPPRQVRPMRIVPLPLSCTEDRLIGSLDIEALLRSGRKQVQAGILGEANRNLLYVDEVNLLPDHLVDDILDAAASHRSRIEREGISVSHPAEFVLVGTMNPEEGELRPQILDRFPLSARVETIHDPQRRAEIVRRNLEFERDPSGFHARFAAEEARLRQVVVLARRRLSEIDLDDELLVAVATACGALKVDGQRPDIVIARTARAIAALEGHEAVRTEEVLISAQAALGHRTRDGGLREAPAGEEVRDAFQRCLASRPLPSRSAPARPGDSRREADLAVRAAGRAPGSEASRGSDAQPSPADSGETAGGRSSGRPGGGHDPKKDRG